MHCASTIYEKCDYINHFCAYFGFLLLVAITIHDNRLCILYLSGTARRSPFILWNIISLRHCSRAIDFRPYSSNQPSDCRKGLSVSASHNGSGDFGAVSFLSAVVKTTQDTDLERPRHFRFTQPLTVRLRVNAHANLQLPGLAVAWVGHFVTRLY